jgi:hypothetical protein
MQQIEVLCFLNRPLSSAFRQKLKKIEQTEKRNNKMKEWG